MTKLSWSQPICARCWVERNYGREPVIDVTVESWEQCCYCGQPASGIYVRVDPATVTFPSWDS